MITYSTGEFAKRANVSIRTIRYYDQKGVLKPSQITETGYRVYTDYDFAKLQKIIVLKNLGFTLEEIIAISSNEKDHNFVKQSLDLQLQLVKEKMNSLKIIEKSIKEASQIIDSKKEDGWDEIVRIIHLLNMEQTLAEQYKNSRNIDVRVDFHNRFTSRVDTWFEWIYSQINLKPNTKVLEIGCGNGELWTQNMDKVPDDIEIVLSDVSAGMIRSVEKRLGSSNKFKQFTCFDCNNIPFSDGTFDIVIANHVMFYVKNREQALQEIKRVLKKNGIFYCTTYGQNHMKEIEQITKEFDHRIALSEIKLYDIFGLEHGSLELGSYFGEVKTFMYEDYLLVNDVKALMDYILSCHGNQMKYLQDRLDLFEKFLRRKIGKKGIRISKEAGMFICYNNY